MSDKVDLIAAAQVTVTAGVISFASNHEFKTATRSSAGVYDLEMEHKADGRKLVIALTPDSLVGGIIQGAPTSQGDTAHIQITNFDTSGDPADTSFFIQVSRIRS